MTKKKGKIVEVKRKRSIVLLALLVLCCMPSFVQAQRSIQKQIKTQSALLKDAITVSNDSLSAEYSLELGKLYLEIDKHTEAKENFDRSLDWAVNNTQRSMIYRWIGKLEEARSTPSKAAEAYEIAVEVAPNSYLRSLNSNDLAKSISSDQTQKKAQIEKNISLSQQENDLYEEVVAIEEAITYDLEEVAEEKEISVKRIEQLQGVFDKAQEIEDAEQKDKIESSVTDQLIRIEALDKASEIQKERIVQEQSVPYSQKNTARNLRKLAEIEQKRNAFQSSDSLLKSALKEALQQSNLEEYSSILLQIDSLYQSQDSTAYAIWRKALPSMINVAKNDSTLVGEIQLELLQQEIDHIVSEKKAQNKQLEQQTRINYAAGILLLLSIGIILYILHTVSTLRKQNAQIALQSLRREMNPHFLFNCLNSINLYVAEHDEKATNRFISDFSVLLRRSMELNQRDKSILEDELSFARQYMEIEKRRFGQLFSFTMQYDLEWAKRVVFPSMLLQPLLENALWHGIRYLENTEGRIEVVIELLSANRWKLTVKDNGIGILQSKALKTKHQKMHKSRGLQNMKERIDLLNTLYSMDLTHHIVQRENGGTSVEIECNLIEED